MKVYKLSECTEIYSGSTPSTNNSDFWDGSIVWITPRDLSNLQTKYVKNSEKKITEEGYKSCSTKMLPIGSVLLSSRAPIGHVAIAETELCTNQGFKSFIPKANLLCSDYLYYWLKANKEFLQNLGVGATFKEVSKSTLANVEIPLPSLEEQRRIASILDKADDIRQKRQQAIAKLDELLQATFIDMFGDPVSNPSKWPVIQVSEVCSEIVDCVNKTAPIVDYETPYKMIRTTNVRNYKVDVSNVRYVEKNVFDIWNRRLTPQRGDVILTREAPVGEVGILESDDNIFLGQRLMLYRANLEMITPEYLLFFLMSENLKRQYEQVSSGSTVKHLSVVDCKKWKINLPPIHIQREFSTFYQKVREIDAVKSELSEKTEQLFSSLQQKAFNGTL
jgi:type I restriction enzyme S subunit